MVGKKAYIRTLEAIIAIVLLLFATFYLTPKQPVNPKETPYVIQSLQNYVVMQVTDNRSLRDLIINYDGAGQTKIVNESLNGIIESKLPAGYGYRVTVCMDPSCVSLPELQTSVYTDDVLIAGQTADKEPVLRLVRVWFWPKS